MAGGSPQHLLGRDRELEALFGAVESAGAGRGAVFLLCGEPGIGKTRLADAVAERAASRGLGCHWGRSWEAGGAPAYWPWTQVMRGLARASDVADVPLLAGDPAESAAADSVQARFLLFDRVRGFLEQAAGKNPLAFFFDDLHSADRPSLLLLQFLARDIRRLPILLVGTYRDVEVRLKPELGDTLARVAREGVTFALRRLERAEVAALLESSGLSRHDDVTAALHQATDGNPLFLHEMLHLFGARGGIEKITTGRLPLPDGVREVILDRLRSLSAEARTALEVASVVGREFPLALVAGVAGLSLDELRDTLAGALAAELIAELDPGRCSFSHILVRDALYFELAPSRRARLHDAVASVLERAAPYPVAELAHHAIEGASVGGIERAIRHAERAAQRALAQLAYEEAVAVLERALAILELGPADPRQRCALLLELARAEERAGERARARDRCLRAADLAEELGDRELVARAALGLGEQYTIAYVDPVLVALLQEALAALPESDGALRARVMARLAAALQPADDPEDAMDLARDAVAMARRLADPPTLLATLRAACSALADFADPTERLALDRELVALADELGERAAALRGRARIAASLLDLGQMEQADRAIADYERSSREFEQPIYHWRAPLFRAMRALMDGRFAEAENLAEQASAIGERARDEECRLCLLQHRVGAARAKERSADVGVALEAMRASVPEQSFFRSFVAIFEGAVAARLEHADEARVVAARFSDSRIFEYDFPFAAIVVEVLHAARATDRMAPLYAALLHHEGRCVHWGLAGMIMEGPMSRLLALGAETLGRFEDSARHFESAIERAAAAGARAELARIRYEYGRMLLERGVNADRARAVELVESALGIADELDMPDLVKLASARLLGASPNAPEPTTRDVAPPAAPLPVASFAIEKEGDVWAVRGTAGVVRLKDSRGLQILAELVARPDQEIHVLDLAAPAPPLDVAGDAGEALDRRAIAAYRQRLEQLQDAQADAESLGNAAAASHAKEEMDAIAAELARGLGLGNRARRASSNAERARTAVQRRLRDAIRRVAEHDAALGRHLEWAVHTGAFCSYRPRG
jgi:eukaryotic-like serine/threonine-protein kinase